ncbi:aminomethyl-transferring glycine dehydrogenase subunit GcvPA [Allosphingosinicella sp.]|uniref:aminomethyl-transferring glycine dehydrogenase subunit GcvPA n=1 Tax=Allosphingosinicella sp. TaxID=2823234 RepID=UPI002EFC869B
MRYLPLADQDRSEMFQAVGAASIEDLFTDVPEGARLTGKIQGLPDHATELQVERRLSAMARRNMVAGEVPFFLGCGAYRHHIPSSVDHLIQRGEFLTSYTPYQPEIAQGTLQVLFEFQTQVARLFGCDVANASMYDGSTACWEAIGMARRITRRGKAILSSGLHPHYVSVARTMARFTGDEIDVELPKLQGETDIADLLDRIDGETSCVVFQYPDILGRCADMSELAARAHEKGALLIAVVTEPVAMGLLRSPGEMGADIVVGEGQSLGVGLNFGGPYVGLFACAETHVRQMPGRLVGMTRDAEGSRGFVLTLSTREQHIRREKATSNICTSSVLCALAFSMHLTLLGENGLRKLAEVNFDRALYAAERFSSHYRLRLVNKTFFNEFTLSLNLREARPVVRELAERGILGGVSLGRLYPGEQSLERGMVVAFTETATKADIDLLVDTLREMLDD